MTYTAAHLAFLKAGYKTLFIAELTAAFNKKFKLKQTECAIKSCLNKHKIRVGAARNRKRGPAKLLNAEQIQFLTQHYKTQSVIDVTASLNARFNLCLKPSQIKAFTKNHGIKSGRTGHFKQGHKPFNAGTKGLMKATKASFKKGHVPYNFIEKLGTEIINRDGYTVVKIANPNQWEYKHRLVFERHHGPIPAGTTVYFKDGNKSNLSITNLTLGTHAQTLFMNQLGYTQAPADIKPSIALLAQLKTKLSHTIRETNGEI